MRDQILRHIRTRCLAVLANLDWDNVDDTTEYLTKGLELLRLTARLPEAIFDQPSTPEFEFEVMLPQDIELISTSSVTPDSERASDAHTGVLVRQLLGGVVKTQVGDIYISEGLLRRLGFDHGDVIRATPTERLTYYGHKAYYFELVSDAGRQENLERIELTCLVGEGNTISHSLDERYDTYFQEAVVLTDDDVTKNELIPGDCVNIVFWSHNPGYVRVAWKHKIEKIPQDVHRCPKVSEGSRPQESKYDYPELANRQVVILAGVKRSNYVKAFADVNASVELITGDESYNTLCSVIRKAHVVVMISTRMSHHAQWDVKKICKDIGVPFKMTPNGGLLGAIMCAAEALRTWEQHDSQLG